MAKLMPRDNRPHLLATTRVKRFVGRDHCYLARLAAMCRQQALPVTEHERECNRHKLVT